MFYNYKGFEIEKITRNTFRIRPEGTTNWNDMFGHYPKTLRDAKILIDDITANERN